MKPTEIDAVAAQKFQQVDLDNTGRVDFDQFASFYQNISTTKARKELRSAMGPQIESESGALSSSHTTAARPRPDHEGTL